MADKVQKIREELVRLKEETSIGLSEHENGVEQGRMEIINALSLFLDFLQEEPKFKTGDRIKPIDSCLGSPRTIVDICDSWYVTDQGTLDFEYEDNWELIEEPVSERFAFKAIPRLLEMIEPTDRAKAYIAKLGDALEVEGYHTDAKIVRESLKVMNGEKVPMATMDEEPVSEDFEEALAKEWKRYVDRGAATVDALEDNTQELTFAKGFYRGAKWQKGKEYTCYEEAFEDGAKWQKAKDESTTEDLEDYINELSKQFPEVSFAKLSRIAVRVAKWQKKQDQSTIELAEDHAMLAGMEKMKEEMMAKAIDVEVKVDAGGYPYVDKHIELYDYDKDIPLAKAGEKVKVIVIKEK